LANHRLAYYDYFSWLIIDLHAMITLVG